MIDYNDVDNLADVSFGGCGPIIGTILFILFLFTLYFAEINSNECEQKHCDFGKAKLLNHECLCVEGAK